MTKLTPHQESIGWLINAAALRVNRKMRQALQDLELTQGQFAILKTLAEQDNLSQVEIGRCVDLTPDQMTRQLDILEQKGLLGRFADPNSRRTSRIKLSEQGRSLAPQLFALTEQVNADFARELNRQEQQSLIELLHKLVRNNPK
jgi:DNA-binding MarR family transcriptional regulator